MKLVTLSPSVRRSLKYKNERWSILEILHTAKWNHKNNYRLVIGIVPIVLVSFCLSKGVFINCFLKLFVSLEILSSLFRLYQLVFNRSITGNDRLPSVELLKRQRRFNLPKRVLLERKSEFYWSIDFRCSSVFPSVLLRVIEHLLMCVSWYRREASLTCREQKQWAWAWTWSHAQDDPCSSFAVV